MYFPLYLAGAICSVRMKLKYNMEHIKRELKFGKNIYIYHGDNLWKNALGNVLFTENFLMSIAMKDSWKLEIFHLRSFRKVLWRETSEIEKLKIDREFDITRTDDVTLLWFSAVLNSWWNFVAPVESSQTLISIFANLGRTKLIIYFVENIL